MLTIRHMHRTEHRPQNLANEPNHKDIKYDMNVPATPTKNKIALSIHTNCTDVGRPNVGLYTFFRVCMRIYSYIVDCTLYTVHMHAVGGNIISLHIHGARPDAIIMHSMAIVRARTQRLCTMTTWHRAVLMIVIYHQSAYIYGD